MQVGGVGAGSGAAYAGATIDEGPAEGHDVADLAEVMVQADREERDTARLTAQARSAAARQERRAAISEQRAAAEAMRGSAITRACIGIGVAALQAASAGLGASAAAGIPAAEAATDAATKTALQAAAATSRGWSDGLGIAAQALDKASGVLDPFERIAEDHRIASSERADRAQTAQDEAARAESDAEAARGAQRSHIDALGKTLDLQDRCRTIAIGRESA